MKRVFLKKPLALTSVRLPLEDIEAWRAASAKLAISQSELLRRALRDISRQTLEAEQAHTGRDVAAVLSDQTGSVLGIAGAKK
jgi:hypothetical protein